MNKSESIKNLAVALAKFNGEISKISKDAKNPQFRSEYVTLDALIQATRPILHNNGLSVMQFPLTRDSGEIGVQTMLIHDSGEYIESDALYMTPVRMVKGGEFDTARDPQAAGSTISYLRRYSYQAILNLNTGEDDDGNKASDIVNKSKVPDKSNDGGNVSKLTDGQIKRLYAIAISAGYNKSQTDKQIMNAYKVIPELMTKKQYDDVCKGFEKAKEAKAAANGN